MNEQDSIEVIREVDCGTRLHANGVFSVKCVAIGQATRIVLALASLGANEIKIQRELDSNKGNILVSLETPEDVSKIVDALRKNEVNFIGSNLNFAKNERK